MVAYAFAGVDPETMGTGPIPATEKALRKAGLGIDDIGLIEINEAFAVQVLAFTEHFGLADDDDRVNQYGGAIAMGHPLASSGVRLMTQLARQFAERPDVRYGLTTMCVGLGMGGTVIWENPHFETPGSTRSTRPTRPTRPTPPAPARRPPRDHHREAARRRRFRARRADRAAGGGDPGPHQGGHRVRPDPAAAHRADHAGQRQGPHPAVHLRPAGPRQLDAAITAAFDAQPDAIAVTGKPFVFAVGADLSQLGQAVEERSVRDFVELGHRVFGRLRTSPVPTFAFVNGAAVGGGMELALHCHYRTLASNAAMMSQPEVFLGILPGWGGTQLLPRIIGPDNAVTVIMENALNQNRTLKVADAARLGVVDVVLDAADFLEQSLVWFARQVDGETSVTRVDFAGATDEDWETALQRGRLIADMRTHGAAPAAYRALDMIELARTTDLEEGLAAERAALIELIMSHEFRAGVYAFNLVQKRARKPAGAPDAGLARRVTKVGVVGAGLMAGQLALLFARQLHVPVVMSDVDQARLDKGLGAVRREIETLAGKKRITRDEANRLTALLSGTLDLADFADADFVVEAVFEELDVKRQVFGELEKHVAAEAVLATNTSALSVSAMAEGLQHPERVVGFHFFNPVALMPLLEIVRGRATDDPSLATAFEVAKQLRKRPGPGRRRDRVRRQPAAAALHGRGAGRHRRGHSPGGRGRCAGAARHADEPADADPDCRPCGRPARPGVAARDLRRPLCRVGEPPPHRAGRAPHPARLGRSGAPGARPRDRGDLDAGRPAVHRRAGAGARAGRARGRGPADPRRGRRRRCGRHRPGDDHRGRHAVLAGRNHAVPGPDGRVGAGRGAPVRAARRRDAPRLIGTDRAGRTGSAREIRTDPDRSAA